METKIFVGLRGRGRTKGRKIALIGIGIVFSALILFGPHPFSASSFAAELSPSTSPSVAGEVLVRFREGVDDYIKALSHFGIGTTVIKHFYEIVEGLELVKLPPFISVDEALTLYRQLPYVLYAEPNYIVNAYVAPNDPRFGELWGLHNVGQGGGAVDADIDAPRAWDITTGNSDVVVAVIDTGVDYNHQDLSANMFRNASDCNNNGVDEDGNGFVDDCYGIDTASNDSNPMDDNDHGTHVAGTIGAVGNNSISVVGVNWDVSIMACKFLDANGSGSTADAIDCLNYVGMMKDRGKNIIATNNSWGGGGFSQALRDAIEAHRQRGILFIAAAGNGGSDGIGDNNDQTPAYPCNYYLPNVICVAATTRTDARSSFSNFGRRTVHLGAPGSEILSTTRGNTYKTFNGTSMATPHVTGVAALLQAQDPGRDWRAIKNLILAGGDTLPSLESTVSHKRLNANGALSCSNSIVFSRLRPISDAITGSVGTAIDLAALHINCANPNGNVSVTVDPGGQIVTLLDQGLGSDQAEGDGIYSGQWIPTSGGTFTLTFSGGDVVTVTVAVPVAPSNLTASAVSSSQINLRWQDNSSNETEFRIQRKTGAGGTWGQIATVGANSTTYANTGLAANMTYYYRVRACNAAGCSAWSNEASATTGSLPDLVVTKLNLLVATAKPGGRIRVSDKVKNQGTKAVGGSTTRYYLSSNSMKGPEDTLLSPRKGVGSLVPGGQSSEYAIYVNIPQGTTPGQYFLFACADDLNQWQEISENNNCTAAPTKVTVMR